MSALRGIIYSSLRASRVVSVRYGGSHAAPQSTTFVTAAKRPLVSSSNIMCVHVCNIVDNGIVSMITVRFSLDAGRMEL